MSVIFIDPWKFIYDLNEHRMHKGLRYLTPSDFITSLTKEHCKNIINGEIPFSLEHSDIRKRKLSSCVKNAQEIMAKCAEDKNLLTLLLTEDGTRVILEGTFNLFGVTVFQIGVMIYIHLILAETY